MRYISPFEELGIEIDGNLDKNNLNLAKKRLLAELDLSDVPTILRGSVEMTKNDIINQFDKLASLKNWEFHRLIAADKALLGFIQHKEWDEQKQLLKEPKYGDLAFVDFVSPYFSESYTYLIIKHLAGRSVKNLTAILDISPRLLTEKDHYEAWLSVEYFLEDWKGNLNEIAENVRNGQQYGDKALIPYQAKQFIQCLNLLPDDFKWFRDDYATALFNLSAYSWNKEKHYRAIDIVKNARLLDISDEIEQMLDERIAWFEEQIGRSNASKSSDSSESWSGATIFRVVLFVIFLFVKLATCGNTSKLQNTSNIIESASIEYTPTMRMIDSFSEKYPVMPLTVEEMPFETTNNMDIQAVLDLIKKMEAVNKGKLPNKILIDSSLQESEILQKISLKNGERETKIDTFNLEFKKEQDPK